MKGEPRPYEKLYNSLREIGVSLHAAELYQLSLTGELSITQLSNVLGVSRPNVYELIKELDRHSLIKPPAEEGGRKKHFLVEPPNVVLEKLRSKKEALARLDSAFVLEMPDLLAQYQQRESPTRIRILQGKEQYLKILDQSLEEAKDEMSIVGSFEHFVDFVSWERERWWIKQRVKKGVRLKALLFSSEDTDILKERDAEELRETRVIKDMERFPSSYMLYANKCIFWQPKAPLALLVEDQYITQMMSNIFEKLWEATSVQ